APEQISGQTPGQQPSGSGELGYVRHGYPPALPGETGSVQPEGVERVVTGVEPTGHTVDTKPAPRRRLSRAKEWGVAGASAAGLAAGVLGGNALFGSDGQQEAHEYDSFAGLDPYEAVQSDEQLLGIVADAIGVDPDTFRKL